MLSLRFFSWIDKNKPEKMNGNIPLVIIYTNRENDFGMQDSF